MIYFCLCVLFAYISKHYKLYLLVHGIGSTTMELTAKSWNYYSVSAKFFLSLVSFRKFTWFNGLWCSLVYQLLCLLNVVCCYFVSSEHLG